MAPFPPVTTGNTTKLCGALIDLTGNPAVPAYAGVNDDEMVFRGATADAAATCEVPATAAPYPHWCLGIDDVCAVPPAHVIEEVKQAARKRTSDASVSVQHIATAGGVGIHQVISRMFGGY